MPKPEKYRTHDSPTYVEPEVIWPPSLTDPSQDIPMQRLVDRFIRLGDIPNPALGVPGMSYGDDLSRVGFTELSSRLPELKAELEARLLKDKEAAAAAAPEPPKVAEGSVPPLQPGSLEVQALAASLTRLLPGFELKPIPPKGGADKP